MLKLDCVCRVWISSADVQAVAEKGFKMIHAASDFFYLVSANKAFRRRAALLRT